MDELPYSGNSESQCRGNSIRKILQLTRWYSSRELIEKLSLRTDFPYALLDGWLCDGRVFMVDWNNVQLFAAFQFDEALQPLPVIKEVMELLNSEDNWASAGWFLFPNGWLSSESSNTCVAPVDMLQCPAKLVNAARCARHTHFC
jgi:hypothetical protein